MPLQSLPYIELKHLYDKTFDPYQSTHLDKSSELYQKYEQLRNDCKYYKISDTGTDSFEPDSSVNILHMNARSLINNDKFEAIQTFLYQTGINWDFICISETWLSSGIDVHRNLRGYTVFFNNRLERSGGGVAIYVRNDSILSITQLPIDSPHGTEALFIQCDLPSSKVVVGQVYRPPGVCPTLFTDQMTHILETVCKLKSPTFICGDFNFDLSEIFQNETVDNFLNLFTSFGFFPLVTRTTRYCDSKLSLLDNIFCNDIGNVSNSGLVLSDLSDHFPVFMAYSIAKPISSDSPSPITSFNYNKIEDLRLHLQLSLHDFLHETNPELACERICQAYATGLKKYSNTYFQSRRKYSNKAMGNTWNISFDK